MMRRGSWVLQTSQHRSQDAATLLGPPGSPVALWESTRNNLMHPKVIWYHQSTPKIVPRMRRCTWSHPGAPSHHGKAREPTSCTPKCSGTIRQLPRSFPGCDDAPGATQEPRRIMGKLESQLHAPQSVLVPSGQSRYRSHDAMVLERSHDPPASLPDSRFDDDSAF